MHPKSQRLRSFGLVAVTLLLGACATSTVANSGASASAQPDLNNILVIGVANDYEGRTRFERKLAKDLTAAGMTATPLYVSAGGNKPIERQAIEELVSANSFDGVLISRVVDRDAGASMRAGSTATKAVRKGDRPADLFRYDYEELNEPVNIDIKLSVTISTELFAASSKGRVWALESSISNKEILDEVINEAIEKIVRGLQRDGFVDR